MQIHGALHQRLSRSLGRLPTSGQRATIYGCKPSATKPRNGYNLTIASRRRKSKERSRSVLKNGRYPKFQPRNKAHDLRCRTDQPQRTKQAPMVQEPRREMHKAKRGEAPQPRRSRAHRINHQGGLHRLHRAQNNHPYTQRRSASGRDRCRDPGNPRGERNRPRDT